MNDIEILERYINGKDTMKESLVRAIENLLKRNKELEKYEKYYQNETNLLDSYIPKSLVREKMEKYKKQIEKMEKEDIGIGFTLGKEWSDLKAKVEFGQSLLEKE